jgi:N-acetylmuramoyl-L-alanine amidase
MTRTVEYLAVHCSATQGGKPFRAADIDKWHRAQGWSGIGYHFVIPLDGSIEPGRPLDEDHELEPNEVGSHVKGFNAVSIGICLIGGVDATGKAANTFNRAQFLALDLLLRGLRARWPNAKIQGHRDFPKVAKECPSFDVRAWCAARGIEPK